MVCPASRVSPHLPRLSVSALAAALAVGLFAAPVFAATTPPTPMPSPSTHDPASTPAPGPTPEPIPTPIPAPAYSTEDITMAVHRPDCAPVAASGPMMLLSCGDAETVVWDGQAASRVDADIDHHPLYSHFVPLAINARGDVAGRLVKRVPTGPEHAVAAVRTQEGTWRTYSVPAPASDPEPHGDKCDTDNAEHQAHSTKNRPLQARRELRRGFTETLCRKGKPLFSYSTSAISLDDDGTALIQTLGSRPYVFRQAYLTQGNDLVRLVDPQRGDDVLGFTLAPGKVVYGRAQLGVRGLGFAHVWPTSSTCARLRGINEFGASEVTAVSPDGTLVAGYVRRGSGQGRPAWLRTDGDPQFIGEQSGQRIASVVSPTMVVTTDGLAMIGGNTTDLRPFASMGAEVDILDAVHLYPTGDVLLGVRHGATWSTLLLRAARTQPPSATEPSVPPVVSPSPSAPNGTVRRGTA